MIVRNLTGRGPLSDTKHMNMISIKDHFLISLQVGQSQVGRCICSKIASFSYPAMGYEAETLSGKYSNLINYEVSFQNTATDEDSQANVRPEMTRA